MSIKVNIHVELQHLANNKATAEVKGNTVGECLNELVRQFPDLKKGLFDANGKLLNYIDIYVNLESTYPEELAKQVKDGDEIHITIISVAG